MVQTPARPARALGEDAIIRTSANEHLFQLAKILDDAQRRGEAAQIEDGITHQLPRPVIGDVSSAVGLEQRDAAPRQQLVAGNNVLAVGIPAQGKHGRMLDQQQHIADALLLAQGTDLLLQGQRRGVVQAAEIHHDDDGPAQTLMAMFSTLPKPSSIASARVGWA